MIKRGQVHDDITVVDFHQRRAKPSIDISFIYALLCFHVMRDNFLSLSLSFEVTKNNSWNDNGMARVDGPDGDRERRVVNACMRGWGRNNVFRRRHFYRASPLHPGLLLFPMLYVNCTVKSHYIRAQCVHYTPCQKHFYPLEFFSSNIHLLSPVLVSLVLFFLFFRSVRNIL